MKVDFTRLLVVLIGFLVAQKFIQYFLVMLGFSGITLVILYNFLLAGVATLIYYPSGYKKMAFKDPEFYKNLSFFFLIFLLLTFIGL